MSALELNRWERRHGTGPEYLTVVSGRSGAETTTFGEHPSFGNWLYRAEGPTASVEFTATSPGLLGRTLLMTDHNTIELVEEP